MNSKNKKLSDKIKALLAAFAVAVSFTSVAVYAAGGVDGVDDHSGCGDTPASERNTHDYFDCCANTASCPHWIKTSGSVFASASDPDGVRTRAENVDAAGICAAATEVVWVGRDANGNNVLDNDEGSASGQHKQDTMSFLYDHDHVDVYHGEWNTVRLDVMEALGLSDDRTLAFFCPEMLNEQVGKITPDDFSQTTCAMNSNLYAGERIGSSGSISSMIHTRKDHANSTYRTSGDNVIKAIGRSSTHEYNYTTYARPGDHIQYEDKYCYGAQGVKGNTPTGQTAKIKTTQSDNSNGGGKLTTLSGWDITENYNQSSSNIKEGVTKTSTDATLRENDAGTNINSQFTFNSVRSWIKNQTSLAAANGTSAMSSAGYPWYCGKSNSFTSSSTSTLSTWSAAKTASNSYSYGTPTSGGTYYGSFKWGCKSGKPEFTDNSTGTVYKWKTKPDPGSLGDKVKDADSITYDVKNDVAANVDSNMTAVIPYNFDTTVSAGVGDGTGTVGAGEGTSLKYTVGLINRINTDVDSDTAYHTWTPKYTKVQTVRFIIPSTAADYDPNYAAKLSGAITTSAPNGACQYYTSRLSGINIDCRGLFTSAAEDAKAAAADPTHHLGGANQLVSSDTILTQDTTQYTFQDMAVPDEPGAKFCVATAVYPADSHDLANDFSSGDDSLGLPVPSGSNALTGVTYNGQYGKTSPKWRISGATCATIAKKSNLQIWGSTYTNSGVDTLLSRKRYAENPNTYGSFADGTVVAKKAVERMASASVLGFSDTLNYYGGYGGNNQINYCDGYETWSPKISLSSLIVGKADNCNNGDDKITPSLNSTVRDKTANYRQALQDRFVDAAQTSCNDLAFTSWDQIATSSCTKKKTYLSGTDAGDGINRTYYRIKSTGTVSLGTSDKGSASYTTDPDHNARITSSIEIPTGATLIIQADKINIIGNICYGTSTNNANGCNNGTNYSLNAKTILKDRNTSDYANISQLPQSLLFATSDINIRKEVYQVDSWLISEGSVKTCDWDAGTRDVPKYDAAGNEVGTEPISAEKAEDCARLLMVNGPILSRASVLRRSGGSFSNTWSLNGIDSANAANKGYENNIGLNGSVTPAEIFNLRPDVYMWSYWQAQQYTQAISSYTRELAPRL